jgi:hypothetical protein
VVRTRFMSTEPGIGRYEQHDPRLAVPIATLDAW